MTDQHVAGDTAFDRSRQHRRGVRQACVDLEEALARPAGTDASGWCAETAGRAAQLLEAFRHHVRESEGPDGLLPEIVDTAPRLANAVQHLKDEHAELLGRIEALGAQAADLRAEAPVTEVRERALRLLSDLAAHRHRGAELIYEAYSVDVEGGDG